LHSFANSSVTDGYAQKSFAWLCIGLRLIRAKTQLTV